MFELGKAFRGLQKLGIFLYLILILTHCVNGQRVTSKPYELMLDELLSHSVQEIEVDKVNEMDSTIVFLDAREKEEFDISHIKNAKWIGYDDFNFSRVNNIPKDTKIIIYCSVGYRSEKVAERLVEAGFKKVYNLYGSIFEWMNQGKPVYNSKGERTKKVHAYDKTWGVWLKKGNKVY